MENRSEIGEKHHYVPKFYLKHWAGEDGCVCEFSRPYQPKPGTTIPVKPPVKARRVHPDGTGYLRGLNTFARLRPELANYLEHRFFRLVDTKASAMLEMFNQDCTELPDRSSWSRFLMSQIHRSPEGIQRIGEMVERNYENDLEDIIRENYDGLRGENDPPTFEEYQISYSQTHVDALQLRLLSRIMDSENVGTFLNRMRWYVINTFKSNHPFLTSDRPLAMTNGLERPDAHIVLPISPFRIFVATHSDEISNRFDDLMQHGGGVQRLNHRIIRQARKYVWGIDDRALQFVEGRLGDKIPWCPWE